MADWRWIIDANTPCGSCTPVMPPPIACPPLLPPISPPSWAVPWVIKQYVDAAVATALPLSGGTMTGPLDIIATGGNTPRSVQDRWADVISVLDFGAKCDGTTDDTAAVVAALASGHTVVTIPPGRTCYLPNGITVPAGVWLRGGNSQYNTGAYATPTSTILTGPNINCVTLDNSAKALSGSRLSELIIRSNNTSTPTNGSGVYIREGSNVWISHVGVQNTFDGFYWQAVGAGGIEGYMHGCTTYNCAGNHVVQDTWPELRLNMCRFGGTFGAQAYILETGGISGDILPNGLFVTNCQFNESGTPSVGALLLIANMVSGASQSAQEFQFVNCHCEHSNYIFQTDTTVGLPSKVRFVCNTLYPGTGFMAFPTAGGRLTQMQVIGNDIESPAFTLNTAFWECQVVGNNINANVTLNSTVSDSTLAFIGNGVVGNIALSGAWGGLTVSGSIRAGTLTNTATGNVIVELPSTLVEVPSLNAVGPVVVGSNAAAQTIALNGPVGSNRLLHFETAGLARWDLYADVNAESGGGAGSNLSIARYNDSGAYVDVPWMIYRLTGLVTVSNGMQLINTLGPTIRAGTGAATGTQPSGSLWLRTDGAAGSRLYVSAGGGTWAAVAGV